MSTDALDKAISDLHKITSSYNAAQARGADGRWVPGKSSAQHNESLASRAAQKAARRRANRLAKKYLKALKVASDSAAALAEEQSKRLAEQDKP